MEISFRILRICIYVYATDIQNVHLQTVPDPCPDVARSRTIADMCTTDYATEEDQNGGLTVDSVELRVMNHHDGCKCESKLNNQKNTYTIYMRKYDLRKNAAPEKTICGLAIDIDYNISNNFPENKSQIECTEGTSTRSISLTTNGILHFRSRISPGNFSRGYCIQIYIHHSIKNAATLQLHCSQYLTTPPDKNITKYNESASENVTVRISVIIAAVIGWCLAALFAITTLYLYRRMNKQKANNSGEPNANAQYQDLYVT